jgi:hypothetical protein
MSSWLGRIHRECLLVIEAHGAAGKRPTTFGIAVHVYPINPDNDGYLNISDAQHTAVKRALAGLRRKGLMTGAQARQTVEAEPDILWRTKRRGHVVERCCFWSTVDGVNRKKKEERQQTT